MHEFSARVCVIGAGYVGLVTAACLAELGHTVTCLEIDHVRLALLEKGILPIHESGLDDLVTRQRRIGRLRFTNDYALAIPDADFAFIAVNTPQGTNGNADTGFVFAAVRSVLAHARPGLIIVTKSTVPVGTGDEIAELASAMGQSDVAVVANPEFLREGTAVRDFLGPDRVVIGASDPAAAMAVARLYTALSAPIVSCTRRSAELAKYVANALLAARISFMNEMAAICEATNADIDAVERIVGLDHRIGPNYLKAGVGWGGSCFPKDVRALMATAAHYECAAAILEAVVGVNSWQRERTVKRLREAVGVANGEATVGVLGLAFKPGTDDIREAPALSIIRRLLEEGIRVRAHDPVAMANARRIQPEVEFCETPYDVARGADAMLLATEWSDYLSLDWTQMYALMRGRTVVDGRNVLDVGMLTSLGFSYLAVGRSPELHSLPTVPIDEVQSIGLRVGLASD